MIAFREVPVIADSLLKGSFTSASRAARTPAVPVIDAAAISPVVSPPSAAGLPKAGAWPPPLGRDLWGPQRAKLRGRTFSPTILLFAPGSTTPNTEPNDAKIGLQPPRR